MKRLSPSKERFLELLREFARRGQTPTMNEIAAVLGVSKQAVHKTVAKLRSMGLINGPNYKHRSLKLTGSIGKSLNDDYKTPPDVTWALLNNETFSGGIWEPACGDGAMVDVLIAKFGKKRVKSTDIHSGVDFLKSNFRADNIVTNPPFSKNQAFVKKALELANRKVALLLPLAFLEAARRLEFLNTGLKTVYAFYGQQDLKPISGLLQNHPTAKVQVAWFVWERGYFGANSIQWME